MEKIVILGASGSIGTQAINIIKEKKNFELVGISVGENLKVAEELIQNFSLLYVCLKNKSAYKILKKKYPHIQFFYGDKGLLKLIKKSGCESVLNALVGFSGVMPSIESLKLNKILYLANKESLVCAGDIINELIAKNNGKLYPIDSEHVAIEKCLKNVKKGELDFIGLTCSGGPFLHKKLDNFDKITLKDALKHPSWSMGKKITVDSATLMNKAFEIIEAHYLFDVYAKDIKVFIDPNSYVHSLIHLKDGTYKLQVSKPSMQYPLEYALAKNRNYYQDVEINTFKNYKFYEVDKEKFPLINYGYLVVLFKGNSGVTLNAANDMAVKAFLEESIKYIDIKFIIDKIMKEYNYTKKISVRGLMKQNRKIVYKTNKIINELKKKREN